MNRQDEKSYLAWVGLVTGPVVFLINVVVSFSVLAWVCLTGQYWAILAAGASSSVLTVLSGWSAFRTWHYPRAGRREIRVEQLMGFTGVLISGFYVVALGALWARPFFGGACG